MRVRLFFELFKLSVKEKVEDAKFILKVNSLGSEPYVSHPLPIKTNSGLDMSRSIAYRYIARPTAPHEDCFCQLCDMWYTSRVRVGMVCEGRLKAATPLWSFGRWNFEHRHLRFKDVNASIVMVVGEIPLDDDTNAGAHETVVILTATGIYVTRKAWLQRCSALQDIYPSCQ